MIRDMTDLFEEVKEESGMTDVDMHRMLDGIYIRVDPNKTWEENFNNLDGNVYIKRKKDEEDEIDKELRDWFKVRDFYSNYMNNDANKMLDMPKRKLHNTNHLTLFSKADVLKGIEGKGLGITWEEHMDWFVEKSKSKMDSYKEVYPIKGKKKEKEEKEKKREDFFSENYGDLVDYLEGEYREEEIEKSKRFWTDSIQKILDSVEVMEEKYDFNNYVKIFFDEDEEVYRKEYLSYIISNIFIKNNYNYMIEGKLKGIPQGNITVNYKKPFLFMLGHGFENRHMDTLEGALKRFELFGFLKGIIREKNTLRTADLKDINKGRESRKIMKYEMDSGDIVDFDNLPRDIEDETNETVENYVGARIKGDEKEYSSIKEFWEVRYKVLNAFFGGKLTGSLYRLDPKVGDEFTNLMQSYFKRYKSIFYDWFEKGYTVGARSIVDEMTLRLILDDFKRDGVELYTIKDKYNYRLFLLKYLEVGGKEAMGNRLVEMQDDIKRRMDEGIYDVKDREEFYFTVGQVIAYLTSQSEAADKNLSDYDDTLRATNAGALKRKITSLIKLYGHKLGTRYKRFNDISAQLYAYDAGKKIKDEDRDFLMAGLLFDNMFYHKSKKSKDVNEEGEMSNE